MNKLNLLESMGFKVSWKLINIGLRGHDEIPMLLNHDDVIDYLENLLSSNNKQIDDIVSLICSKDNPSEFNRRIATLASNDRTFMVLQKRKWRVYLLKNTIDNISKDYLQGILELMEFWASMGIPNDCPQTFPSSDNAQSVQEYFTQSSYKLRINENCAWACKEVCSIVELEKEQGDSSLTPPSVDQN